MELLPVITVNLIYNNEIFVYNMLSARWNNLLITPNKKVSVKQLNRGHIVVETNTLSIKSFFKMLFRKNSISEE